MGEQQSIPVVCFCGAYLRSSPDAIGKIKVCSKCHHAIEVRRSDIANGEFSTLFLKAARVPSKGKARWKLGDEYEGFVEQIALRRFEERGWQGVWGENALWEFLMALLFWEVYFARVDGAWQFRYATGSTIWEEDMPLDLGHPEFYERRKAMIDERVVSLRSLDLGSEIRSLYSANYGKRCRPIWNWEKFSPDQLASVATAIPTTELLQILVRILRNYGQARSGLPDLFLWKPGSCAFVEVKGPRDKLASHQVEWLAFLYKLRFRVFVVRVEEG